MHTHTQPGSQAEPSLNPTAPQAEAAPAADHAAAELVLREARRLHKAATSGQLATSLPILRRLLASQVLTGISLPELSRQSALVQRKHLLRLLAIEAGHASWEDYRRALDTLCADQLEHFDIAHQGAGHLNLWFSTLAEAQAHAAEQGGRAVRVGQQAVVLIDR
ncbi:MAG: hypothetical protein RIQ60_1701 [Pseudomonadota bacterium]|jgi:hypothetical protein